MAKFRVNAEVISVYDLEAKKSVYLKENETHDSAQFDVNHLHALASNGKYKKVKSEKTGKVEEVVVYLPSISWLETAPKVKDEKETVEKTEKK